MDNVNLGSDKFWIAIIIFAVIGFVTSIIGIIKGIVWLFNHVNIS